MTIDRSIGASLNINSQLCGGVTLTSISAYSEWDNTEVNDRDYSSSVNRIFGSLPNSFQLHETGIQHFQQFSQELRLSSHKDASPLQYTLGLFYLNVNSDRQFTRDDLLCLTSTLVNSECRQGNSLFLAPSATADLGSDFENHALFGQSSYDLSDHLTLIGGLRWTRDSVSYEHNRVSNLDHRTLVDVFDLGAPGIRDQDFSRSDQQVATDLSGKLGIQYQVADDVVAYGTYSTGFKGPAFDVSFSFVEERSAPILPEDSTSYEIGVKGMLAGGKLYAALAAYYTKVDQYQTNNVQLLSGNITSNLVNVGQVVSSGIEFDFVAKPNGHLELFGGFGFLHKANIRKPFCTLENEPGADDLLTFNACQARSGERLMLSPKRKITLGMEYKRSIGERFDLYWGGQYVYRSDMFSNDLEDPLELLESIHVVNANIGFANKTDSQRLTLVAKNLTDQSYASQIICCTAGGSPVSGDSLTYQIPREADRYFGVNYRLSF